MSHLMAMMYMPVFSMLHCLDSPYFFFFTQVTTESSTVKVCSSFLNLQFCNSQMLSLSLSQAWKVKVIRLCSHIFLEDILCTFHRIQLYFPKGHIIYSLQNANVFYCHPSSKWMAMENGTNGESPKRGLIELLSLIASSGSLLRVLFDANPSMKIKC